MKEHIALLGERMGSRVQVADSGCWLWTGALLNGKGYGWTRQLFGTQLAHRIAYMIARGQIPAGLDLDHLCRQRNCVNPDHLEPVTRRVNVRRGVAPPAVNAKKTHCPKGHSYDEGNTIQRTKRGITRRWCRACDILRKSRERARAKAMVG